MRTGMRAVVRTAIAFSLAAAIATPALGQDLQGAIEKIINGARLGDARIGIQIVDVRSNRVLASRDAQGSYLPASNMKLFTTGAALEVLGPGYAFETRLELDSAADGQFDLWLVGDGDPALADPAILAAMEPKLDIESFLAVLGSEAVKALDGQQLRGIVVDDRVFDRDFVPESWPIEQLNMSYAAEVGGVNIHSNVLRVFPEPSRTVQSPPTITVEPKAPWIEFENRARTSASGQHSAWVARPQPKNEFTLFGSVPQSRMVSVEVAFHNPPEFAGTLLARSVIDQGGSFSPEVSARDPRGVVRLAGPSDSPTDPRSIAIIRTPLLDVISRCNKASENLYAEALLKRAGHAATNEPGSLKNGASVLRMVVRDLVGSDAASEIRVGDGSGLSRENRITPAMMASWLSAIAKDESLAGPFYDSLPMPGESSTTLRTRFRDVDLGTEVRAKSGSINGVRCLSGYVRRLDGSELVAFSILVNDLSRSEHRGALDLHEQIVDAIDDYVGGASAVVGG